MCSDVGNLALTRSRSGAHVWNVGVVRLAYSQLDSENAGPNLSTSFPALPAQAAIGMRCAGEGVDPGRPDLGQHWPGIAQVRGYFDRLRPNVPQSWLGEGHLGHVNRIWRRSAKSGCFRSTKHTMQRSGPTMIRDVKLFGAIVVEPCTTLSNKAICNHRRLAFVQHLLCALWLLEGLGIARGGNLRMQKKG